MNNIIWPVSVYAVLLILLGGLGYYQAGSLASLYAGGGFGIALLFSTYLLNQKNKKVQRAGAYLSLTFTILLTIVFAIRHSKTQGEIPAVLAVVSGFMLLYLLAKVLPYSKE
jgi:uncharacterized membrane protein (UPF0136 family)